MSASKNLVFAIEYSESNPPPHNHAVCSCISILYLPMLFSSAMFPTLNLLCRFGPSGFQYFFAPSISFPTQTSPVQNCVGCLYGVKWCTYRQDHISTCSTVCEDVGGRGSCSNLLRPWRPGGRRWCGIWLRERKSALNWQRAWV